MIRFAFIGGTLRGMKLLQFLLSENKIPEFAVVLKEDDHELIKCSTEITDLLEEKGIPFSIKKKLSQSDYTKISESELDFIIVSGWRTLIDTSYNKYLKLGFVAAHQSLLPQYRGFAPTQWVIINGEKETGVTLFKIEEGEADSGKIFAQKKISIDPDEYAAELDSKISDCTIKLFSEFFEKYESGKLIETEQDESKATYACKRTPDDGRIDWNKSSFEIYNLIRALAYPFPGAFCFLNDECFIIRQARLGDNNSKVFAGNIPGRVCKIQTDGVEIHCGKGTVMITEWENKNTCEINCPSDNIKSITTTLK